MKKKGKSQVNAEREGLYQFYADLTVPEPGHALEETVNAVMEMIS